MDNGILKKPYEISIWDDKIVKNSEITNNLDGESFDKMKLTSSDIKDFYEKRGNVITEKKECVIKDLKEGEEIEIAIKKLANNEKLFIDSSEEKLKLKVEAMEAFNYKNKGIFSQIRDFGGDDKTEVEIENFPSTLSLGNIKYSPSLIEANYPLLIQDSLVECTFGYNSARGAAISGVNDIKAFQVTQPETGENGKLEILKSTIFSIYARHGLKFLTSRNLLEKLPKYNDDQNITSTGILQIYTLKATKSNKKISDHFKIYPEPDSDPNVKPIGRVGSEEKQDTISLDITCPINSIVETNQELSFLDESCVLFLIPGAFISIDEDGNEAIKVKQGEQIFTLSFFSKEQTIEAELGFLAYLTSASKYSWDTTEAYVRISSSVSIPLGNILPYSYLALEKNSFVEMQEEYSIVSFNYDFPFQLSELQPVFLNNTGYFYSSLEVEESEDSYIFFTDNAIQEEENFELVLKLTNIGNKISNVIISTSKNNYKSVEDYRNINPITEYHFEEEKLFIIGSDTMDSQARALKPKLVRNINGSNTLTFSMYYQYEDNITGETVLNPYCKYLCNERKIKLKHGDKWYDFVIKNIQENSETKEFIYTAKDLYINELSKNGFELTFDIEKENNIGTITYLGEKVVEGTDWSIDKDNSDHLAEMKVEPLYEFKIDNSPKAEGSSVLSPVPTVKRIKYLDNEPYFKKEADNYSLVISDFPVANVNEIMLLVPYSALKDRKKEFQAFFTTSKIWNDIKINYGIDEDYNLIIESTNAFIYSIWLSEVEWEENKIIKLYSKDVISTEKKLIDYRAKVLVQSQSMKYDSMTGKLVSEYEDTQGRRVYCFEETEFTSPTLVRNLITNSKYFTDTTGWDPEGDNSVKFDYYPSYWGANLPYLGCKFPSNYIKNSAIEDNRSIIKSFQAGELYILRIKASRKRPNSVAANGNREELLTPGYKFTPSDYDAGSRAYMGWYNYWDTWSEDYGGCSSTFPLTNGRGLCGRIDEYEVKNGNYILKEHIAHFSWGHTPDYVDEVSDLVYNHGSYNLVQKKTLDSGADSSKYGKFCGTRQAALKKYIDEDGEEYLRYAFRPYHKWSEGKVSSPPPSSFLGYNNPIISWGSDGYPEKEEFYPFLIPVGENETDSPNNENYEYKYMLAQITKSLSYNDLLNKRIGLFLYSWGPYTWNGNSLSSDEAKFQSGNTGRLIQNLRIEDIELFPFKTEEINIIENGVTKKMAKIILPEEAPKQSLARNTYNCYYPMNQNKVQPIEDTYNSLLNIGDFDKEHSSKRPWTYLNGDGEWIEINNINEEGSLYNNDFKRTFTYEDGTEGVIGPWGESSSLSMYWGRTDKGAENWYGQYMVSLPSLLAQKYNSDYKIKRFLTDLYLGNEDLYGYQPEGMTWPVFHTAWQILVLLRRFISPGAFSETNNTKNYPNSNNGWYQLGSTVVRGSSLEGRNDYGRYVNYQASTILPTDLGREPTNAECIIQIKKALDLAGFQLVFEEPELEGNKTLEKNDIYYAYKGTIAPEKPVSEGGLEWTKVLDNTYEKKRILNAKESNRFNIIQKLSENFECWAKFTIEHDDTGKIIYEPIYNNDGFFTSLVPVKKIAFKKFIGKENFAGFNYGINLKGIQRIVDSDQIVSKIIVKDNTNEFGEDGFCTIARAGENPTKENILYNFDHYIHQNMLKLSDITKDLYDPDNGLGFYEKLRQLNINKVEKNQLYTELSTSLISITANFDSYKKAYDGAQEEILNVLETLKNNGNSYINSIDAIEKLEKKKKTSSLSDIEKESLTSLVNLTRKAEYFQKERDKWEKDKKEYEGKLNVLDEEFKERSKKIEALYQALYAKYSRFIQEGTWHSDDYYDDNQYYLDALNVANTSARPKISYNISVIDVSPLEGYEAFTFEVGDKTFMTDPDYFGYISNGDLYKEEIVVSETTQMLDSPEQNQIKVQNYTSQFEDLFQRITAATQALEFNKNSYDRAAKSFTSSHNLK